MCFKVKTEVLEAMSSTFFVTSLPTLYTSHFLKIIVKFIHN